MKNKPYSVRPWKKVKALRKSEQKKHNGGRTASEKELADEHARYARARKLY